MKVVNVVLLICVCVCFFASLSSAVTWHDSFDDFALDNNSYQIIKSETGSVEPAESSDFGGQLELKMNNPGGSYALTAVKVQGGDTVRTVFTQFDAWNDYSVSVIGLAYTLSTERLLDVATAAFYMQHIRQNVMAYKHVGADEQLIEVPGVGDPAQQQAWIFEMQVGQIQGGGVVDVTFSVYDLDGTQRGSSVTMTTQTPTGRLYWFTGDNRTIDFIHSLHIGDDLPPPGPATCSDARNMGQAIPQDLNHDCHVDLADFAMVAEQWQTCNDPLGQDCAQSPVVTIGTDKRLYIDNQPFFPLGIYLGPTTDEHLARIADAGFNTLIAYNYGRGVTAEQALAYLDRVQAHGLWTFYDLHQHYVHYPGFPDGWPNGAEFARVTHVRPLMNHPALLGWSINDEELPQQQRHDQLLAMYTMLQDEDPDHPALSVTHRPADSGFFFDVTDIMAPDPYPVDNDPLTLVSDWVDLVHTGMQNTKPVWVVIQTHALDIYTEDPTDRAPTLEEMRTMTYLGLIHRVTGVLFYSYRELWRSEGPDDQTWGIFLPRWNDVSTISQELQPLLPVLEQCNEWNASIQPDGSAVEARGLSSDERYYLLAANPSYDPQNVQIQVALPAGQWHIADQLTGTTTAEIIGDSLYVTLPPLTADTIVIEPVS